MGDIVGGIFGAIGASQAAGAQRDSAQMAANASIQNAQLAAKTAMTGFNYLTNQGQGSPEAWQAEQNYINTGQAALPRTDAANSSVAQLLGTQPVGEGTKNAFNNYLGSTGYNFQLQQGINAINSSTAAKGLLQSGGTAKALSQYGQNLASTTFGNYLNQLTSSAASNQNQGAIGQAALASIGGAGSQGGAAGAAALSQGGTNASNALMSGGLAAANSGANMWRNIGGAFGGAANYFGNSGSGGDSGGGW